ncbi:unnamed protein product, partial [Pleuronectes platessa]
MDVVGSRSARISRVFLLIKPSLDHTFPSYSQANGKGRSEEQLLEEENIRSALTQTSGLSPVSGSKWKTSAGPLLSQQGGERGGVSAASPLSLLWPFTLVIGVSSASFLRSHGVLFFLDDFGIFSMTSLNFSVDKRNEGNKEKRREKKKKKKKKKNRPDRSVKKEEEMFLYLECGHFISRIYSRSNSRITS